MKKTKTKVKMDKAVYSGMSVLNISKTLMYKSWYDYIKPRYGDRANLCYMGTDSFIIHIILLFIIHDFYKDIADDVNICFDTSNYDENDKRHLPIGKSEKVIGLFKDVLRGKIMKEFCALRAKTYAYLIDDDSEKKKAKGTKKCVTKDLIRYEYHINSLYNGTVILRSQQRFKSDHHKFYTEEVNKVVLSSNDDKRLQIFDRITSFQHRTNISKLCESKMMAVRELLVETYAEFPFYDEIISQQQK